MPANTDYQFTDPTRSGQYSVHSDGQSVSPSYHFSSETSLGFYRSAASVLAQSYGTFAPSNISATGGIVAASAFTSAGTTKSADVWTSRLSVGGSTSAYTGTQLLAFSFTTVVVPAMVVQGSASTFTVFVWPAVRAGDAIMATPMSNAGVSSISSGLIIHSHATVNGQCEIRYSNVSTLAQNQSAQTLGMYRWSAS